MKGGKIMQTYHLLDQMLEGKLVIVIRGSNVTIARKTAEACMRGGAKTLEITFTIPGASELLKEMTERYNNILFGAGTVLDAQTASLAITAGANFIVSPGFDKETAKLCNQYGIPYFPGCMTVNEILYALQYGVSVVKLFPGDAFSPNFIKSIHGPLPHVNIMPTGGITLDNVGEWFEKGAVMVGIGGEITRPSKNGEFEKVEALTRSFQKAVQEV